MNHFSLYSGLFREVDKAFAISLTCLILCSVFPPLQAQQTTEDSAKKTDVRTVHDSPVTFTGSTAAYSTSQQKIRIGMFTPTEPGDSLTMAINNAAALAVDEINSAGGCNGQPVEIVQRWSDDPWGAGSKEIIRLAYEDSVLAVVGSIDGEATHVAEQVVTKAWLPLISPVSADPTLNYIRIPWMFRLPPDDASQASVIVAEGLLPRALQSIGIITSTDHDGRIFADEMVQALQVNKISTKFHLEVPDTGFEPESIAQHASVFKHDAVIVRLPLHHAIRLLNHFDKIKLDIPVILPWIPGLLTTHLRAFDNTEIMMLQPFQVKGNKRYETFASAYQIRYGSYPAPAAAYIFDALNLIFAAFGAGRLDRSGLRDSISKLSDYEGVTGRIEWDNTGGNKSTPVLFTKPVRNSNCTN